MNKIFNYIEEVFVVLAMSIMSIITFSNVVSRNLLSSSIAFTEEITINLFVLLTFVGASIGVRKSAHLGFNLLYDISSVLMKKILIIFVGLITLSVFLIITYFGYDMAQFQQSIGTETPALGWPQSYFSYGLCVGALFCAVRTVQSTYYEFINLRQKGGE
ncbi:TRAP transporter small permease [Alkalibacillus salilacus]|uniref:TRAP-type C4-dicarboxylate transport system permease small subunit n=1 Tax=Alkalibacillus salilacus TaxID=284582 RepID=A0ABT9VB08_9BACI|nr:TRAP transporter small permease [Alkalibacillus salilacus]MDQ0158129.1 TRAP-type C4-dicarboxylate transport system permease small subunit [Alkalibacillus salilacus]